jgi:predicted esterase
VEQGGLPLGEGRAVMIMVHGRGAGPEDMLGLAEALGHPAFTFLAPAAAGHTWYPYSFLAPIGQNEPGISSGLAVVHQLVDEAVTAGVPAERVMLLGFSQGACLSATAAWRRPERYGGVIVYSGGLIGPPGTTWDTDANLAGTPVFFGCSDRDPHVPEERVRESAAVFEAAGAAVTTRIYPGMGHAVNQDEVDFTRELMERVAAT